MPTGNAKTAIHRQSPRRRAPQRRRPAHRRALRPVALSRSDEAGRQLAMEARVQDTDLILEVGPGIGSLTQKLAERAQKVVAIEKDRKLVNILRTTLPDYPNVEIIQGDILSSLAKPSFPRLSLAKENRGYKLVANLPYYITSPVLRMFLQAEPAPGPGLGEPLRPSPGIPQPELMVVMVQKEVAERIARSKKESVLSVSVKVYGEPKYVQTVKAGSFTPAPKVDSAILSIENISKDFFSNSEVQPHCLDLEKRFFEIVKAGFAHKRKLLISNLSVLISKETLKKAFIKFDIKIRNIYSIHITAGFFKHEVEKRL